MMRVHQLGNGTASTMRHHDDSLRRERRQGAMRALAGVALPLLLLAPALDAQPAAPDSGAVLLLRPARVYDGAADRAREGWVVLVRGERIAAVGPAAQVAAPAGARTIDLPGATLLPGLIEAHAHLLLHSYDETPWDEQVLYEPLGERVARATVHARNTLLAGFTTVRDLGTEGAGDADIGLRRAIERGIIPGPRLLVSNRALVATGSYAPNGFAPEVRVPQGAEEADGTDDLVKAVRRQIAAGADWIKVYADYRWGAGGTTHPTFSLEELRLVVETARSACTGVSPYSTSSSSSRTLSPWVKTPTSLPLQITTPASSAARMLRRFSMMRAGAGPAPARQPR
ncbi:MAG TPA: amidohydrolase family protein [Gemmatimonadaceae bacterium]|nr:amidohydrolase family protein [Gemmatimonadaceae bacterium]